MERRRAIAQLQELKRRGMSMRLAAEEWQFPWQTLIAIMMSARTRDEVTIRVGEKLFLHFRSLEQLARARPERIEKIIRSVNFYRNKARAIHLCAKELMTRFNGIPPKTLLELVSLPGVGRKTANVYLAEMGKSAIGVDTHVAYISRALGWTNQRSVEKIERDLEKLFPRRYWRNVNSVCVRFGKTYTRKREKDLLLSSLVSC